MFSSKIHKNTGLAFTAAMIGIEPKSTDTKKQTVLETHGYNLGKSVGSGSYATVRVG